MYKCNYLSVGIDVGSTFSWMSIVAPNGEVISKPFKITHNNQDSLERAVSAIRKAEASHSIPAHAFMEATGVYHYPLFCFLIDRGFEASIINPIITHSMNNATIRKVKNDKVDSLKIARIGLSGEIPTSQFPAKLVLELRSLTRKYYDLTDERSANINKLKSYLHVVFPQYLSIFSDITGKTSTMILREYGTPEKILRGHKKTIIQKISKASRKGLSKAAEYYDKLYDAALSAESFSCQIDSIYFNISLTLSIIEQLDSALKAVMENVIRLVDVNKDETLVKQVRMLESIPGIGFLSAVTLMCEIGDFSNFDSPKQLFAYFGLDPAVNQSGHFQGTDVHMSKRGSRIARRAIFTIALASIRTKRNGEAINPHLREYYDNKVNRKPKKVALGAIMHKVSNIIFAVLRDEKEFTLRSPEEHRSQYQRSSQMAA